MAVLNEILDKFEYVRILSHDTKTKLVYVLGQVDGKHCILSFEKTQYTDDIIPILSKQINQEAMEDLVENNIYGWCTSLLKDQLLDTRVKFIYPATELHISKYEIQERVMVIETPEIYEKITLPYIKSLPEKRIEWVYNILNGVSETDKVIYRDDDRETGFVILPDMKWNGSLETLYWVAIAINKDILSLRSLNSTHLDFLKKIKSKIHQLIKEKAGLDPADIRLFIHYQPSYYHFHIHITALSFTDAPGVTSGQAHLLDTVINNIELFSDYYQKVTIPFVIGKKHPLNQHMCNQ